MSKAMELLREGRVQEAVNAFDDKLCGRPEEDPKDAGITALRELIRGIRDTFNVAVCKCDEAKHGMICNRCWYLHYIDKSMAAIDKTESEGK